MAEATLNPEVTETIVVSPETITLTLSLEEAQAFMSYAGNAHLTAGAGLGTVTESAYQELKKILGGLAKHRPVELNGSTVTWGKR